MSDKVRIVSVETVTRVCEFSFDEFRTEMKQDDDDLTEASIMKMWLKLIKKKEYKRKDTNNYTTETLNDLGCCIIYEILKINKD